MLCRVIFLFVLLLFNFINAQLAGDACIREYDNAHGVCRHEDECPQVRKEFASKRIPVTECSYMNGRTIVCCPKAKKISSRKCEEYSKLAEKKINVWGLLLTDADEAASSISVKNCDYSTGLVRGGNVTKTGEFPHMAAIGWRKGKVPSFECGGSLISESFVLTAAHCKISDGIQPSFVRLGDQNLRSKDDGAEEIDVEILRFIKHPKYNSTTDKNDIALIELMNSVEFTKFIRPACLWQSMMFNFSSAIATGWGALEYGTETSEDLMKVELKLFDTKKCNDLLSYTISLSRERFLDDTQVCSGVLEGGKDTCQGDSGGPLQISFVNCVHHVIGITSYGSRLCGTPNAPAVYTKVSAYLDWIESIVWG